MISLKNTILILTGQPVNYFSLLGWENRSSFKRNTITTTSGKKIAAIISSLKEISFASPRGWFK